MAPDVEPPRDHDDSGDRDEHASWMLDAPPTVPTTPIAPTTPVATVTDSPAPGWYPDPWLGGHYRYWNGAAWTGDSFRGPDPSPPPPPPPPSYDSFLASGSPTWEAPPMPPSPPPSPPAGTAGSAFPPLPPPPPGPPSDELRMSRTRFAAVLALVAIVVGSGSFLVAYLFNSRSESTSSASAPNNTLAPSNPLTPASPSTTVPPTDPSASALSRMGVTQDDVGSTLTVQTISQGQSLGQPTLDLCNGSYPSESLRTARLQVAAADSQGNSVLSTEAVLYRNAGAAQQAFKELTSTAANCPTTPVPSPVGGPTFSYKFNPAPDGSWSQVDGVQRLAYDFVTTDANGQTDHSVAVYLERGRALLGVYFQEPDNPPTVAGQSTVAGIVNALAARLGQLQASSIGA